MACTRPTREFYKKGTTYVIEMNENKREIKIEGNLSNTNPHGKNVYSTEGLSPTLCAGSVVKNGLNIKTNTQKGYEEAYPHDGVRLDHPNGKTGRGRVQSEKTGTLTTSSNWGTVDADFRIRKLTPVECERLQAFPDNWTKYGKDDEIISNTQRYKCCGNAVTTTVITYIADEMFKNLTEEEKKELDL